jgi:hypothetical protein
MPDPSPQLSALLEAVEDVLEGWYWPDDGADWVDVDAEQFQALQKAFNAFNERHNAAPEGDPPDWSAA